MDSLKGTGFSPYISPPKYMPASAPEGMFLEIDPLPASTHLLRCEARTGGPLYASPYISAVSLRNCPRCRLSPHPRLRRSPQNEDYTDTSVFTAQSRPAV